ALDLLSYGEAHELLARHLGPERLDGDPLAVDALITGCARLPLALAIVAARAATQRTTPLAEYVAELADAQLDALDAGDRATQVRAVFSWSYQRLGTPAARLFRLLGLHPGPDISAPAAASLAGEPVPYTRTLLGELTRAHLLAETSSGRYGCHDLLRAYATEQANRIDPADHRQAALHRVLDHYLHTGHAAALLVQPHRPDPVELAPAVPGVLTERLRGRDAALAWFTAERSVLLGAMRLAADAGFDSHIWQQAWTLTTFLEIRGHWDDWLDAQRRGLAATERLGDRHAQARVHNGLGIAYAQLGHGTQAHTHYACALELFVRFGDLVGQARTHMNICWVLEERGEREEALAHARQALELYRAAGRVTGQADALNGIGWLHSLSGEYEQALAYCELALSLQQEAGDRHGEAATWDSLGHAHHHLGNHRHAIACYRVSSTMFREFGDRYGEADVLDHLGDAHQAAGDAAAAGTAWGRALELLQQLGHADADRVRAKLASTRTASAAGR
ncbi:MAG TPA: tetratricopeptide repeat protein, partial [Micromonosporaceae bacterium]|nr:tetratricopeptide repeat protein [Micromonosporaceae bacterium]